jgi:hypothetical protein
MPYFDANRIEVPRDGCLSVRKAFYDNSVASRAPGPGAHEMEVRAVDILVRLVLIAGHHVGIFRSWQKERTKELEKSGSTFPFASGAKVAGCRSLGL